MHSDLLGTLQSQHSVTARSDAILRSETLGARRHLFSRMEWHLLTRKNEMVGWTHWTDTGLIWWDSMTVLPVLHGTIGQDGQGFFRAVVAVLHGTIGQDGQGFFRAVVAVLHGTI